MKFINRNPKIYVLSGKAESGKDEVANIICNNYKDKRCKKLAFAYYLKNYIKDIYGWNGDNANKPRELLQKVGIDLLKNKIDTNFLINRLLEDIKVYSYFYDVIIVTDARLIDEIEILKQNYPEAVTIRVISEYKNKLTVEQKEHITETNLDNYDKFDYKIKNTYDERISLEIKKIIEVENEK